MLTLALLLLPASAASPDESLTKRCVNLLRNSMDWSSGGSPKGFKELKCGQHLALHSGEAIELVPGRVERQSAENDPTTDCRALLQQMDWAGAARMRSIEAEWERSSCGERMLAGGSTPKVLRLA